MLACVFPGCVWLADITALPVWWGRRVMPDGWLGGREEGSRGEDKGRIKSGLGIWRVELFWEGGFVCGGWNGWVVD